MEELNIGWFFLMLIGGITIFVFFGQKIMKILELLWYVILQIAVGSLILFLFNLVGQFINLNIPLNLVTALFVGMLGVPGIATLSIIKWVLLPL